MKYSLRSPTLILVTLCVVGAGALVAFVGYHLYQTREAAIASAEVTTRELAVLLERHAADTVHAVDTMLQGVVKLYRTAAMGDRLATTAAQALAGGYLDANPHVRDIIILGASGDMLHSVRTREYERRYNFADRGYFRAHADQAGTGLYISPPLVARVDGAWFIALSRRLEHAGGDFAGVVFAIIKAPVIEEVYAALDLGPGGTITLFDGDGRLMIRHPPDRDRRGQPIAGAEAMLARLDEAPRGTFEFDPGPNAPARIVSFRRVEGVPLALSVALPKERVLAPWVRAAWVSAAITLLVITVLLVLAAIALKQILHGERLNRHLTESRHSIHSILRTVPDPMLVLDRDGHRSEAGLDVEDGVQVGPAAGAAPAQGLPADLLPAARPVIERALRSGEPQSLEYPMDVGGKRRWYAARVAPLDGHGGGAVLWLQRDITAYKEAFAALERTRNRLAEAQRIAHVGSWEWDVAADTVSWSEEIYRIYGVDPNGPAGSYDDYVRRVHPEDRARFTETLAGALASGEPFQYEYRIVRQDGSVGWVQGRGKVTARGEDGRALGMIGTCLDITERKEAEQALRASEARLREQAQQLAEANRRTHRFLATLAHELRNPLTPIQTAADMLKLHAGPLDTSLQWVQRILSEQIEHITRLLDDLLDVARITEGKIKLQTAPIDLVAVIERALASANALIDERRHEVKLSLPEGPVPVMGDAVRLTQVVTNLLHNAVKFMDCEGLIEVSLATGDGEARLRVKDSGHGMPPALLDHVFDVFVQGEDASGGLGLGLTLVRDVVMLHGGRVSIHSEGLGCGSEVDVRLPLTDRPIVRAPRPRADSTAGGGPLSVLLVDDDEAVADGVSMLLRVLGHRVRVARSAREGLAAAQAERPDLVLLDIGLPGMDGYELAARLRELWGTELPLAALTGYGLEADRERALAAGCDFHLVKPVTRERLQALIDEAAGRNPVRRPSSA